MTEERTGGAAVCPDLRARGFAFQSGERRVPTRLALLGLVLCTLGASSHASGPVLLRVTPEEATLPDATRPTAAAAPSGPQLRWDASPTPADVPFTIDIRFATAGTRREILTTSPELPRPVGRHAEVAELAAGGVVAVQRGDGPSQARASCKASYEENPYFVDEIIQWTYFQDVVAELETSQDGTTVAFRMSSRRYEISGSDPTRVEAALSSLRSGTPVHVAVDRSGGATKRASGDPSAALGKIQWLDPDRQHPSCNC